MKNRTHVAVGAAAALAAVQPQTPLGCAVAVAAGALGAAVSDVDLLWKKSARDVFHKVLGAALAMVCLVALDVLVRADVTTQLTALVGKDWPWGLGLLLGLCVCGFFSDHRSFTHSLLGMTLFTVAVHLLVPGHALGFLAGFASHLALDLLNRKPLRLLFPFKGGFSLRMCSADGLVNALLLWVGWLLTAAYVGSILMARV